VPHLKIKLTKRPDGGYVIACTRADGTVTWQRGRDAGFFPLHDITHFAVETELRHRRGFFGLLAEGWEFTDFSSDWPRGRIPADAEPAELIVGLLDSERHGIGAAVSSDPDVRGGESVMTAAEFNAAAARFFEQIGCAEVPPAQRVNLTDEELDRIRRRRDALLADWDALPLGGTLKLTFDVQ
jgi:hypothetical protein